MTTAPTFGAVVARFVDLYAQPRNRDWQRTERLLNIFSNLNEIPITDIKRRDIVAVLDTMIARNVPIRANRALSAAKSFSIGAWTGARSK